MATIDAVLAHILAAQPQEEASASRLTAIAYLAHWYARRNLQQSLTNAEWFVTASGPASAAVNEALRRENGPFQILMRMRAGHPEMVCRFVDIGEPLPPLSKNEADIVDTVLKETKSLKDRDVSRKAARTEGVVSSVGFGQLV